MCEEWPHPSCFAFMREDNWAFCVLASFKFSQSVYKTVIFKMSTFLSILVEISQWFQNNSVRRVPSKTVSTCKVDISKIVFVNQEG